MYSTTPSDTWGKLHNTMTQPTTQQVTLKTTEILRQWQYYNQATLTEELRNQAHRYVLECYQNNLEPTYLDWHNRVSFTLHLDRANVINYPCTYSDHPVECVNVPNKKTVVEDWINTTGQTIKITRRTGDSLIIKPTNHTTGELIRITQAVVSKDELLLLIDEEGFKNGTSTAYYQYLSESYQYLIQHSQANANIKCHQTLSIGTISDDGYYLEILDIVVSKIDKVVIHPKPKFFDDTNSITPQGLCYDIIVFDKDYTFNKLFVTILNTVEELPIIRDQQEVNRIKIVYYNRDNQEVDVKEYPLSEGIKLLNIKTSSIEASNEYKLQESKITTEVHTQELKNQQLHMDRDILDKKKELAYLQQEVLKEKEQLNKDEIILKQKTTLEDEQKKKINDRNEFLKTATTGLGLVGGVLTTLVVIIKILKD